MHLRLEHETDKNAMYENWKICPPNVHASQLNTKNPKPQ